MDFRSLGLILFALVLAHETRAGYILCGRDAEITAVNPETTTDEDPCSGTVLLQGISYKCTQVKDVDDNRRQFLQDLKRNGKSFCEEYCNRRSTLKVKCHGAFREPDKCGFTVPASDALKFGKEMAPCNPACGGQAFAYCSIFHGSYLGNEPEFLSQYSPNCTCSSK